MAQRRPTRRRRRDYQQPGGAADRARTRRREIKPVGQPKSQTGARRERRGGFRTFVAESAAELKKVEWPGQRQLFSATIVVIIAVAVVGAYLYAADAVLSRFVRDVLLNI